MKLLKKSMIKFLKSRARWNTKIQANAMTDQDVELIVNTSILGELCYVFLDWKKPLHFQFLDTGNLIETAPTIFFEYVCLIRKYEPTIYQELYEDVVEKYEPVLKDMYKENSTLTTFSLLSLLSVLKNRKRRMTKKKIIHFTEDLIKEQPKEAVEAIIDLLFVQTLFGLYHTTKLANECIEALEVILLKAIKDFDFLYVSKLVRALAYIQAPQSKIIKKAITFLLEYTPRRMNLVLEVITENGRQKLDEDSEMVKLNKEIMIAVLEWKTDFRLYRDLGNI